jgi:proteasome lid subunit RPN8/RPN11
MENVHIAMKKYLSTKKRASPQAFAPTLRFSPTAWAKLIFLRDRGDTEVGGFGISADDDPLLVIDFQLVEQACTDVTVRFDDLAVADYFDRQVDRGLQPSNFARLWVHTHPGRSAKPSSVDEQTFDRVFSQTDWALMFVLAQGGQTYARLRFNTGPGAALTVPVAVDYGRAFSASDYVAWDVEYQACVHEEQFPPLTASGFSPGIQVDAPKPRPEGWPDSWDERQFDPFDDFYLERLFYGR